MALKQLFPTGKRFSFFGIMSILGVMLGVMVLVVVQTVMNGFDKKIQETVKDTAADIRVYSKGGILYNWKDVDKKVKSYDFVEATAPFAQGMVMMKHLDKPAFPAVEGIVPWEEDKVVPLSKFIIEGKLDDLDDETVILSTGVAATVGAEIGSKIEVYTPLMLEKLKYDQVLLPRELEVVGLFETSMNKIDSNTMLVTLRLMQELYGLERGVHGIMVKLKPGTNLNKATQTLNTQLGENIKAYNWMQSNEEFLFVLRMEKTMMFFIILFIILVAAFSIASSLMTSVVRKTREIGLVIAMGGRSRHVASCFCLQGFIIGVVGSILGCLGAVVAVYYRNTIVSFIERLVHREDILQDFYPFKDLPAHYLFSDFVIIITCTLVIATLAGVLPAIRAARLNPAEALRNE